MSLRLKEFSETDFHLLYSLFSNNDVMRYTIFDTCETEIELKPFFDSIIRHNHTGVDNREAYEYAVYLDGNCFIGMGVILVSCRNESGGCGEIGYLLLPQYWGKGYATQIADTLLEKGFSDLKLHRICARCNVNNAASENVMKKTGMKKEGQLRKVRYKDGCWHDELCYAILSEEFNRTRSVNKIYMLLSVDRKAAYLL